MTSASIHRLLLTSCILLQTALPLFAEEATAEPEQKPASKVTLSPETQKPLINFDLLSETTPDENYLPVFTQVLNELEGKTVSMLGFMVPYESLSDLTNFMLMEVYVGCNFCPPPPLDQVILVRRKKREAPLKPHDYVDGPIEVTGTLRLWTKESTDPPFTTRSFLFVLDDAEVQSVPKERFSPEKVEHRIKH